MDKIDRTLSVSFCLTFMNTTSILRNFGQSYSEYRTMIDALMSQGLSTGLNHSEAYQNYTSMNVTRMNRWDKKAELRDDVVQQLKSLKEQTWVILTEAWCGDAAQNIPWIEKMAEQNENIQTRYVLRDLNLNLMDQHLTNGGRSIPKLVSFDANGDVLFTWGPRPTRIQEIYIQRKSEGLVYAEISKEIHSLYAKDKGEGIQDDFMVIIT
jgi:hypothetical protein